MYGLEAERVARVIRERGYSKVSFQFPEGLKEQGMELAREVERLTGAVVMLSAAPCYGACDTADAQAAALGAEAVFHFGHAPMLKRTAIPVHYFEVRLPTPLEVLEENLDVLDRRVGLVTTVQHVHALEEVREVLQRRGFEVMVGMPEGRVRYPGQVLGCSFRCAKQVAERVECFAYIGSGDFHPLGVALATGRRVVAFDILTGEVRELEQKKERFLRQRWGAIARAKGGRRFGIVLGEKPGQRRLPLGLRLKGMLEGMGCEGYLLHMSEISPESMWSFRHLDAFVCTACPRVPIEEGSRFPKPMLTPQELEIALGVREWEDYEMDEM